MKRKNPILRFGEEKMVEAYFWIFKMSYLLHFCISFSCRMFIHSLSCIWDSEKKFLVKIISCLNSSEKRKKRGLGSG